MFFDTSHPGFRFVQHLREHHHRHHRSRGDGHGERGHECGQEHGDFGGRGGPFGGGGRGRHGHGGGPFGGFGPGGGFGGGPEGFDGGDGPYRGGGGRWFGQGDIRLVVLALLNERARHGYELIKAIEEKTGGRYSPSPGVIYPTLSYLEDAGYVLGDVQGTKKHYSVTDEGKAFLETERAKVDALFERFRAEEEARGAADSDGVALRPAMRRVWGAVMSRARRSKELDAKIAEVLERAADEIARL